MTFWSRFTRWIGDGLRTILGLQTSGPRGYAAPAAATVNFDNAMQLSGVWACVKLLSETIASLPLTMYRMTPTGRVAVTDHPLAILFSGKPNKFQSRVEFFETVALNLVMTGNAYCRIDRAGGRIIALMPMMSNQVEVTLLEDGTVFYQHYTDAGINVLSAQSVWHLKLMGNGIIGLSVLAYQRNTLGIAIGAEQAVTNIYTNGGKRSGVFMIDKLLTPQQRESIRSNFAELTEGTSERLLVLEAGAKFEAVAMSPQDIELLSSRKFQLSEICRWYGVPSVMVNDTSGTTVWGSGIEQIVSGFYKLTLRPYLEKIEASMRVNLLTPEEWRLYEFEFDFEGLLRSDQKSRFDSYRVGVQGGIMTPNEARRLEGLPSMDGGDRLYIQGANVPIVDAGVTP